MIYMAKERKEEFNLSKRMFIEPSAGQWVIHEDDVKEFIKEIELIMGIENIEERFRRFRKLAGEKFVGEGK